MSLIGKVSIKLVLTGIIAFAALILLGYMGFLFVAVTTAGLDPIQAATSVATLGIALFFMLILGYVLLQILKM